MIESNDLLIRIGALCALVLALFNIFTGKMRMGMEFSKDPVSFCITQGILLELAFFGGIHRINALNIDALKDLLFGLFISAIAVYGLSILRLAIINAPFPSLTGYKSNLVSLTIFFICTIGFGYVVYSMTASRDLKISQMKATPLDTLGIVAGTGKLVRVEGTTTGEPRLASANGEELAFQKLRITPLPKGPLLFDGYCPPQFCVTDGKGSVYIKSSDIVEFEASLLASEADNNRADIATTLLDNFDKYLGKAGTNNAFARVWTIKKGAHVSAVGEVVQDNNQNRYILKAPSFWHAPLLGGQLWLCADNGIKTL